MASNIKILQAKYAKVGDFYMDGFVHGKPTGPEFTIESIEQTSMSTGALRLKGAKETQVLECGPDHLVIVERAAKRRTR